jgi:hypothetical protein
MKAITTRSYIKLVTVIAVAAPLALFVGHGGWN